MVTVIFLNSCIMFIVFGGGLGSPMQCCSKTIGKQKYHRLHQFKRPCRLWQGWFGFDSAFMGTGIPLTFSVWYSQFGLAAHLKMFGATILLAAVAFLNMHLTQQAKAGSPPSSSVMRVIPPIARISLALVLIGVAVLTTPF